MADSLLISAAWEINHNKNTQYGKKVKYGYFDYVGFTSVSIDLKALVRASWVFYTTQKIGMTVQASTVLLKLDIYRPHYAASLHNRGF